jgi:predicted glycosyltransferase
VADAARRVLFYVQHLLGIGHLARASRIAQGLDAAGMETLLVTGGPPAGSFPPAGVRSISLPAIRTADTGFSGLVDQRGAPVTPAHMAARRDLLVETLDTFRPDAIVIEAFPFGRRQVRAELLALLEAARQKRPRPLVAASVRDILQPVSKPGRLREILATLEAYFDLVLVHGDPAFVPLEASFPAASRIPCAVAYTGIVAAPPPQAPANPFAVVVSAGGGAAMGRLALTALEARAGSPLEDAPWCIVTGPNAPPETVAGLARLLRPGDVLAPFRADLPALLAHARLSISQAGYNTVGDLLHGQAAMVLVPFAQGAEQEQTIRAARLEALGLAAVVPETTLTPARLGAAMAAALAYPRSLPPFGLDGAAETARVLASRLTLDTPRRA